MTDDGFLDRRARKRLRIKLAAVPRLTEDVLDVMCRQSGRTQSNLGLSRPRKRDGQLPLHLGAADAFTKLRNSLILAVRHTCEDRGLDFMPVGYTHTQGFIGPLNDGERRIPYGYGEPHPEGLGATSLPAPAPAPTTSSNGGYVSREPHQANHDPNHPPPRTCPQHPDGTTAPCRGCADARQQRETWDAEQTRRRADAQRAERLAAAEARAAAIRNCDLCDDNGYRGTRVCDHNPERDAINARGAALAREALAGKENPR